MLLVVTMSAVWTREYDRGQEIKSVVRQGSCEPPWLIRAVGQLRPITISIFEGFKDLMAIYQPKEHMFGNFVLRLSADTCWYQYICDKSTSKIGLYALLMLDRPVGALFPLYCNFFKIFYLWFLTFVVVVFNFFFYYVYCYAPKYQGIFLVFENLLANKPDSDSDRSIKCQ